MGGPVDEPSEAVRQAYAAVWAAEIALQDAHRSVVDAERAEVEAAEGVRAALAECRWPTRLCYRLKDWFHL